MPVVDVEIVFFAEILLPPELDPPLLRFIGTVAPVLTSIACKFFMLRFLTCKTLAAVTSLMALKLRTDAFCHLLNSTACRFWILNLG